MAQPFEVMVYSDNRQTRDDVMQAIGRKIADREISWTESATWEGAYLKVSENKFDLLILDAEAAKLGGIGLGKMIRDEIDEDMRYVVLIGRPQDEWLARVSKPNAIVSMPVDARELAAAVNQVLAG